MGPMVKLLEPCLHFYCGTLLHGHCVCNMGQQIYTQILSKIYGGGVPDAVGQAQSCTKQATTCWETDYKHGECYLSGTRTPDTAPGSQTPPSHYHRSPPPSWRCPHRHQKTKTRKE